METTPALSNQITLGDGSVWEVPPLGGGPHARDAQLAWLELQKVFRELKAVQQINDAVAETLTEEQITERRLKVDAEISRATLVHGYDLCAALYRKTDPDVTDAHLGELFTPMVLDMNIQRVFNVCYGGAQVAADPTSATS